MHLPQHQHEVLQTRGWQATKAGRGNGWADLRKSSRFEQEFLLDSEDGSVLVIEMDTSDVFCIAEVLENREGKKRTRARMKGRKVHGEGQGHGKMEG